ncbi:hypothetical protein pb186bvf_013627 [Paramecium bursaria]
MNYLSQCFQNEDLERKYQKQILKQAINSFLRYQIIMTLVIFILLIDQIIKQNIIMMVWFSILFSTLIVALIGAYKWPVFYNYIKYYYQHLEVLIATLQIFYDEFYFLNISQNEISIYMDIILQVFLIAHIRFNFIQSSFIFIYFISVRVYIQMSSEFSLAPFAYLISGSYFLIDQYQQEKVKRKLFLKSQRNKQFELLIDEFIDDQMIILEKDEEQVKLKTKILNKKLPEIYNEFNLFLKDVLIPQYKIKLQDYFYGLTIQQETLVCQYKNQTYQLTYKVFILKKQQTFLKIKLLDQQMKQLINYKNLYSQMIKNITFKPNLQYKGKNIIKYLKFQSFYYQFNRYFKYYRLEICKIRYGYLKYLFDKCRLSVMMAYDNVLEFHSDKKLLYLLVNLISNIITDNVLIIKIEQQMIEIQFNAQADIKENYIIEFNKILYHIGYGQMEEEQLANSKLLTMILLDKDGLERFY